MDKNLINIYFEKKHSRSASVDYIALCQNALSFDGDTCSWAADAAYDGEHNHRLCREQLGIVETIIPLNKRRSRR